MACFFDVSLGNLGNLVILNKHFHRTPAAYVFNRLFQFVQKVFADFF